MRPSGIGGGWIRLPVRRRRRMLQGAPLVGRVVRWNGTHSNKRTDPVFASARNLRTTGRGGGGGLRILFPPFTGRPNTCGELVGGSDSSSNGATSCLQSFRGHRVASPSRHCAK